FFFLTVTFTYTYFLFILPLYSYNRSLLLSHILTVLAVQEVRYSFFKELLIRDVVYCDVNTHALFEACANARVHLYKFRFLVLNKCVALGGFILAALLADFDFATV